MILAQVRDEMNRVNHVLDEFESIHGRWRNRGRRTQLLDMGVRASVRGVQALLEEYRTDGRRIPDALDPYRVLESMRQDEALLRGFVTAECRLLADMGVSATAVERVRHSLDQVLLKPARQPDVTAEQLELLIATLEEDLRGLEDEARDALVARRLGGVFEALAGGLIVGVDGVIGTGLALATGGISAAGAAVSIAAGTEMLSRGAGKALDS